ncbi:MAG: AmmeMemoRadiSam system protein A [Desulforegulaceae bacterium]|nr:AmmeMemoRadiSam system protein A [Desulforegulaceae bacterium]
MDKNLNTHERKILLEAARTAIYKKISNESFSFSDELKKFSHKRGVFVTLKKNGNLRGCIGNILPEKELFKGIVENALNSAFQDPRFNSLSKDELDKVEIEISVLTVPEKIDYKTAEDLKNIIIPFEHGVILSFGPRQSTFLPSVWEELPEFELFMSHLSMKAGVNPDDWKKLSPNVFVYKSESFSESDY